jgi:hypothetical protein
MSSSKTIKINPELFKVSGRRSRKTTEKPPKPVISPEQLKSKLIARVKQHKRDENASILANAKANTKANSVANAIAIKNHISSRVKNHRSREEPAGTDEFSKSLNFFSELSQRKKNEPNVALSKSIKKHSNTRQPQVNIDLPMELMEIMVDKPLPLLPTTLLPTTLLPTTLLPTTLLSTIPLLTPSPPNLKLNYTVDNLIPGCLKNGLKPTYKSLKRLNAPVQQPVLSYDKLPQIEELSVREDRLSKIKQKMQMVLPSSVPNVLVPNVLVPNVLVPNVSLPDVLEGLDSDENTLKEEFKRSNAKRNDINALLTEAPIEMDSSKRDEDAMKGTDVLSILYPIKHKKTTVRTTRRSYTVGRNKNGSTVGVLVKDAFTRKKVMAAHKELKKTHINDVKKYLREHNLIKAGCSAPNDVLRKTYESVMFTGDVVNTNEETLLHNFVNAPNE